MLSLSLPTIIINAFIIMAMIVGFIETKSPLCLFALCFLVRLPDFTLTEPESYQQYEDENAGVGQNDGEYSETKAGFTGSLK